MQPHFSRAFLFLVSLIACLFVIASPLVAQQSPVLVTQAVDNSVRTVLPGNLHPLARAEFDQGVAPSDLALHRMLLVLKRSDQQETALRRLIENQQYKKSSSYHHWLTPEEFGAQFGPADSDIAAVTNWLLASGLQVTQVSKGRTVIEFDGTAGLVKQAFGTAIHKYVVEGEEHWANASNSSIPTALVPVVAGVDSLHNFLKKAQNSYVGKYSEKTKQLDSPKPEYSFGGCGGECFALSPFDFASIYDLLPLWTASTPINGTGQTIAIVGRTDIYTGDPTSNPPIPSDAVAFWTMFGLGQNGIPMPTLTVTTNGPDPGFTRDEPEADIDTQWSGAAAPGATVNFVTSASTETTDGVDLSALYIVDNNLAPVMSESYGQCETNLGSGGGGFYGAVWEQAAAQGITAMVSTGDNGSAGCDDPNKQAYAVGGLAVSGLASTPWNVAVGGTDFNQYNKWSTYWETTNDATTQQSVKPNTYIPETTWNDSCTNLLLQDLTGGTNNPETNCNNSNLSGFLDITAGSGGASAA
jgi:subtilase family serine protease